MATTKPMALHERIRRAVKAVGKGTSFCAANIGVTEGTLRNWMNGRTEPRYSQIMALSNVSGVSPLWILGEVAGNGVDAPVGSTIPPETPPASDNNLERFRTQEAILDAISAGRIPPDTEFDAVLNGIQAMHRLAMISDDACKNFIADQVLMVLGDDVHEYIDNYKKAAGEKGG